MNWTVYNMLNNGWKNRSGRMALNPPRDLPSSGDSGITAIRLIDRTGGAVVGVFSETSRRQEHGSLAQVSRDRTVTVARGNGRNKVSEDPRGENDHGIFTNSKWKGKSASGLDWGIYNGDAIEILRGFPDQAVRCVVTSPPYFWLRDYGVAERQLGRESSVQEYVENLTEVMKEVHRILHKKGLLFLNLGDTYYSGKGESQSIDRKSTKRRFGIRAVDKSGGLGMGLSRKSLIGIPWRVAVSLAASGWTLRSSIIWHRENRLPEHVRDRPSRSYEYVFMFSKDRHYYFDKQPLIDQEVEEDMWTIAARPKNNGGLDTAPYPDPLVERCLEIGCVSGGLVLDPFVGGGTTVRVALEMGHPGVGIDLNPDFCQYAADRLRSI